MQSNELEIYQIGDSARLSSYARGINYVSSVCADGIFRLVERLNLEEESIGVRNVPLGGSGAERLFDIFEKARQGFRLLSKMDVHEKGTFDPRKFLNLVGISAEDQAASLINEYFPDKAISKPNDKFALSVLFSFTNSLYRLVHSEVVNFYFLGIIPTEDLKMILALSYWKYNFNPEFVWSMIGDMDKVVRAAVLSQGLLGNNQKLLKAAHFFGANLSLRMSDN